MKRKINMSIEAEILSLAKQRADKERRPLGELIQAALTKYLQGNAARPEERKKAYHLFCERPMKIPRRQRRFVLGDDMWD